MLVIVSTLPTALIGFVFKDAIELISTTLLVPGLCLILTGLLLTIADRIKTGNKNEESASYQTAAFVGVAQGISTLPGLSRSGTTIAAALIAGYDRSFAVKYSFIMSIPAVMGAAVLELKDFSMEMVQKTELANYLIGTVIAGVVRLYLYKNNACNREKEKI